MSILLPLKSLPDLPETFWLPSPERPDLPVTELHLWRARLGEAGNEEGCPVSRDRAIRVKTALFRRDVIERYTSGESNVIAGPASGLRIALAQCDHIALIAVSRNVRGLGLDVERVCEEIPIEEMAGGIPNPRSQWDLRITRSLQEKAWKFYQFWTSNEACAQAQPVSRSTQLCQVREFSPEADFIAALAVEGGPEAEFRYWDWQC